MFRRTRRTHDPFPVNSEQLQLALGMPWNGVSPRYLTKVHERFSLASEGTGRANLDPVRPIERLQLELFPEGTHYGS